MANDKKNHEFPDNQDDNPTEYVNEAAEGDIASVGDQEDDEANADGELDQWRDRYTRLAAEYDNYRKRTTREKLELISAGGEDVVKSLLEVLDDMDRALDAIEGAEDVEAVKQGIKLIDNKLRNALMGRGLAEIEALGGELDTDLHEAVARIEAAEEAQKGKIVDVVQKGYKLRDRIIRHAKVVVGQ